MSADLLKLESKDKYMYSRAQRDGHWHIIAEVPCKRNAPIILKRRVPNEGWEPTRRLRQKTSGPHVKRMLPDES